MQILRNLIYLVVCVFISANSYAASHYGKVRAGKAEASFKVNYLGSMKIKGQGGSFVDVKDDVGYGFEFGYNISDQLNASFEFTSNYTGYDAVIVTEEVTARTIPVRHKMDIYNSQFNFTYNFSKEAISPFIAGGLGWSYIDSNIATGPPIDVCWWDPWWGYICSAVQSTYSETEFSYNAKAGVRWDVNRQLFFVGSYGVNWFSFDHARTANTDMLKFEVGVKF